MAATRPFVNHSLEELPSDGAMLKKKRNEVRIGVERCWYKTARKRASDQATARSAKKMKNP
jgi:hypothetical protein